jgi:hypothetical protein
MFIRTETYKHKQNTNTNVAKLIQSQFYYAIYSGDNTFSNYLLYHIGIHKTVGYASNVPLATNNVYLFCCTIEIK